MDAEDLMPCGLCPVCGEVVDHSEAGFCDTCEAPFHWRTCGDWVDGKHMCDRCRDEVPNAELTGAPLAGRPG